MSAWFSFRTVIEEFEAPLIPPADAAASQASGKAERKRYGNGDDSLKVEARRLALADGTRVELLLDKVRIAEVTVARGRVRWRLERDVPRVAAGHRLELRSGGRVVLKGTFVAE
jgi:hypothetical protein